MKKKFIILLAIICVFGFVSSFAETENITNRLDFNDFDLGSVEAECYNDFWQIFWPSDNVSAIIKEGDNKVFELKKYSQISYTEPLMGPYTYSLRFKGTSLGDRVGLFVRAAEEFFLIRNKSGHGEFFETDNASNVGIGATGICIYPFVGERTIRVFVKAYDENENSFIANHTVDIDCSEAFGDKTVLDYANYKFEDTGSEIKLYINDTHVLTVDFSEETNLYSELLTNSLSPSGTEYYKSVTVKNQKGEELLKVDNTLVCAEYSRVGVGARNIDGYYLDHLEVSYEAEVKPTAEPTEVPEETESPTEVPKTSTPNNTPNKTSAPEKDGSNNTIIIVAIAVTAVVVLATVILVIAKRKKG